MHIIDFSVFRGIEFGDSAIEITFVACSVRCGFLFAAPDEGLVAEGLGISVRLNRRCGLSSAHIVLQRVYKVLVARIRPFTLVIVTVWGRCLYNNVSFVFI